MKTEKMNPHPIHTLTVQAHSKTYPELWNVQSPPKTLYIQGQEKSLELLNQLPMRGLAIVGTREPTPHTAHFLKSQVHALRGTKLVILSGFARGIDTIAHQAALDVGLPTLAILGAGLDIPYPRENEKLRERLLNQGGLLISEFPPGTTAYASNFLQRNRLIAAWSQATWVVEAPFRSGSLNTAYWAREHQRTCYSTPCFPGDVHQQGNQKLIDQDHATPYWGVHSLGSTWLELATHLKTSLKPGLIVRNLDSSPSSEEVILSNKVSVLTSLQGGAQVGELLDWAISVDWTPQKFYTALENAIQMGLLIDKNGLLLKNEVVSD